MAFHLLSAAWKGYAFVDDGTRLTSSDKAVLVRIADVVRKDTNLAVLSMEDLAADCSMTEPTARAAVKRLIAHGCVVVAVAQTATRARRYALDLSRVRSRSGLQLDAIAGAFLEGKPLSPRGQAVLPLEGKPLSPRGKATFPVPDLPYVPVLPNKNTGASAPAPTQGKKPSRPRALKAGQTGPASPDKYRVDRGACAR